MTFTNALRDIIEEYAAKEEVENKKAWQAYREDMYAAEINSHDRFADYVLAEISRTAITEAERRQHAELFADFQKFAKAEAGGMTALPAKPELVAGYLVYLRVQEH